MSHFFTLQAILLIVGVSALMLLVWGCYARSQFLSSLDGLIRDVEAPGLLSGAEANLPPEVLALAVRLGARSDVERHFVVIRQVGEMWSAPGKKPMAFAAQQTISLKRPDFIWRAVFSPFESLMVIDYHVGDQAGLEARLAATIRVIRTTGSKAMSLAERMRYLAEIAWAPDAILMNPAIDWRAVDDKTLIVGNGEGPDRAEITLYLGADGLIERMDTAARPAMVGKLVVNQPWGGRFWDYQVRQGRLIPMQGEVYWVRSGQRFIYWRGRLTGWTALPSILPETRVAV